MTRDPDGDLANVILDLWNDPVGGNHDTDGSVRSLLHDPGQTGIIFPPTEEQAGYELTCQSDPRFYPLQLFPQDIRSAR
jgi:hypothetical protein